MDNEQSNVQKIFSLSDPKITDATIIYNEWAIFDELAKSKNRPALNDELNNAKKILEEETEHRLEQLLEFYGIDTKNTIKFKFLALALAKQLITNFDVYQIRWRRSGKDQFDILMLENFVDTYLSKIPKSSIRRACEEAKRHFKNETIGTKSIKTLMNWYSSRKVTIKKYQNTYPNQ